MATIKLDSAQGLQRGGWVEVRGADGSKLVAPGNIDRSVMVRDGGPSDLDGKANGSVTLKVAAESRRWVVVHNSLRSTADNRHYEWGQQPGATGALERQVDVALRPGQFGYVAGSRVVLREQNGTTNGSIYRSLPAAANGRMTIRPNWRGLVTVVRPDGTSRTTFVDGLGASGARRAIDVADIRLAPPKTLDIRSFYVAGSKDKIDPKLRAQYIQRTQPMFDLMGLVAAATDGATSSPELRKAALAELQRWAQAGAMLWGKTPTANPQHMRAWTLSSLGNAYAKLSADATPAQARSIKSWLAKSMDSAIASWQGQRIDAPNPQNLVQWLGSAAAAIGAVVDETAAKARFESVADGILKRSLQSVTASGTLPHEMVRQTRALAYTTFSLTALAGMATHMSQRANRPFDPWTFNNSALKRAASKALEGIRNPAAFAKEAKATQVMPDMQDQGWLLRMPKQYGLGIPDGISPHVLYLGGAR